MIYPADPQYNLRHNAPLIDIASREVYSLAPQDSIELAARLMMEKSASSIVVMDHANCPIGIVTERNLLHSMEEGFAPSTPLNRIMSAPVISVAPETTCLDAYQVCLRDGIRHLVIMNAGGAVLAIANEADFRRNFGLAAISGRRRVSTAMSRTIFHIAPDDSLQSALTMMRSHNDSCVVVVEEKRPVGILTERDIVRLFPHDLGPQQRTVREVMSSPALTVTVNESINDAAERMLAANVRHLVVVDTQGLVAGIISEHDLTQNLAATLLDTRQMAEDALLNTLVNTLPDLVWVKDPQGVYLACNPRFERFFGASQEDIIGKTDFDFVDREQAEAFQKNDRIAMEKGGPRTNEEWVTFADGHREYLETIKSPMYDMHGRVIGVLGIARDITERKYAEAELRIAATAFESLEAMMIADAEGNILRVNRAFTETTGYTQAEVMGKNPRILSSGRQDAAFYDQMWSQLVAKGSWEGEIWNRRKNGEVFPEYLLISAVKDEEGVLTHYVATFSDITERKAAAEQIESLAFYDPLTQLPNRRLLRDRLQLALASSTRNHRHGALLFLDLDHFKTLNDTLGHDVGDRLLQQVAQRLTNGIRENDTVARLGGDEFVVMLEELGEQPIEAASQAETIATKIQVLLNAPYTLGRHIYHSTPSIGITLFNDHACSLDDVLKQADIAMYQAKKAGRNTIRFFDPGMQESINARATLENDLRLALDAGQLELYYQVQMHSTGRVLGAEALIRWNHPARGLVSPAEFIGIAEETGLILRIGQWVLESACARLEAWQGSPETREWTLSVNVSAIQFHQEDFVEGVREILTRYRFPPALLKLELTESLLLDSTDRVIEAMRQLRASGVLFSLDDFGTGYSSLQYLKQLPLNQLKIDQAFVRDIARDSNDESIVRTIIAMARSMDLDYIAEGVETEVQQLLLLSYGCSHYQGYLFGKPMPIAEFEARYCSTPSLM